MKQKTTIHSIIIILTFFLAFYGNKILNNFVEISLPSYAARVIYSYSWWVIPAIIVLGILFGFRNIFKELRLHKGFVFGLSFAFVLVLPMLISSAIIGEIDENINFEVLLKKTVLAGFFEEFLFRGFLFGILFRKLKWGFIPASLIGAVIFGLGHLYQGSTAGETTGIFLVTFMGAVWFAWLFIEWKENLWIPVFLHIFMNLSWVLFDVGNNALGDYVTNIFRIITIALTVIITIIYNKKKDKFSINRKILFVNK